MSSTEIDRDGDWRALHTYLPMSLQTAFLRDVIRPAVRDAGVQDSFFFLRYWQGGPHIRLRIQGASEQTVESVRATLAAAVPALTAEQTAEFEQQASLQPGLADLEGAKPEEVRAPGTVEHNLYSPEYGKYGGTTGIRIAEELFRSTSAAILDLLVGRTDAELKAPAGPAIRVMTMSLKGSGLDMEQSQDFLRVYEEEWRRWVPPGYEEKWADMYEKTRGMVIRLCGAVWRDGITDVFHDTYATALKSTRTAQTTSTDGDLTDLVLDRTPYVHCLANYIHTTNNRLGILPLAEAFLAYVIQRALTELRAD